METPWKQKDKFSRTSTMTPPQTFNLGYKRIQSPQPAQWLPFSPGLPARQAGLGSLTHPDVATKDRNEMKSTEMATKQWFKQDRLSDSFYLVLMLVYSYNSGLVFGNGLVGSK